MDASNASNENTQPSFTYVSIDNARRETGIPNPIFNLEVQQFNSEMPRSLDETRLSIDSIDNFTDNFTTSYRKITNREIDLLCCHNVYSIKTRTYVNSKKMLKMLLPLFVLIILIFTLFVLFNVDYFIEEKLKKT
jgi:hypothetical protein